MKIINVIILITVFLFGCKNPFFPQSKLVDGVSYRETPEGVIKQLTIAYEKQSIGLFRDLIRSNFKFYVSPSFETEYQANPDSRSEMLDDSLYYFVTGGRYYYWTYDEEIRAHEGMFKRAEQIVFSSMPNINTSLFNYILSPVIDSSDNNNVVVKYDTVAVEVRITAGEIKIIVDKEHHEYNVDIGEQVFVLGRDPLDNKKWIIDRWFDLGTAQ